MLPVDDDLLLPLFLPADFLALPRLAEDPPLELLEAALDAPRLADLLALPRLELLLPPFFPAAFLDEPFLAPPFLAALLFALPFLEADFLDLPFFDAAFLDAPFLDELRLPEDEPPLLDEPPRRFLAAPFLDAPFFELLPPERLPDDFLDAAFLVDFAIANGFF